MTLRFEKLTSKINMRKLNRIRISVEGKKYGCQQITDSKGKFVTNVIVGTLETDALIILITILKHIMNT